MTKTLDWQSQLAKGVEGEEKFRKAYYNQPLIWLPSNHVDFQVPDGRLLELKTDFHNYKMTPNFYLERISNLNKGTPGSLWQSQEHGADLFVYYFIENGVYYEFDNIPKTIQAVELYIRDKKPVTIYNPTFKSEGYLVPRDKLKEHYKIFYILDNEKKKK